MKYTGGKCNIPSGRFERKYKKELNRLILGRILTLTVFLDGAKRNDIIPPSVLLFHRKAMVKSSQDYLNVICRDYIAGIGNLPKYLSQVGVTVSYQQDPSEELEFTVSNLATDLRDGVRLGKLAEILGQSTGVLEQMRLPAISRLQKVFNVGVSLSALSSFGVPNVDSIHPNYIVDGHRPQVLKMLWSVMTSFKFNSLLCNERLKQEIYAIHRSNESREESDYFSSLCGNVDTCDNTCDLLLVWCEAICSCYNYKVSNFSASFADGVALLLLIQFYHPGVVNLRCILPTCASEITGRKVTNPARVDKFVENERNNCLLAIDKMKDIGGVPNMFPVSDSFNVPDERATIICVAYLCSRLLESSTEIRAIVIIQNAFRRFLKRSKIHSNRLAVQIIERVWFGKRHGYFRRQRKKYARAVKVIEQLLYTRRPIFQRLIRERLLATRIQKYVRGQIVRCRVQSLRHNINAACSIQKVWRIFSIRRKYLEIRSRIVQFQTIVRIFIAKKASQHILNAIVKIQCFSRRWLANQRIIETWVEMDHNHRLLGAAIMCQSLVRRNRKMRIYQVLWKKASDTKAAIVIQASLRKYTLVAAFRQQKRAVITIQSIARMHIILSSYRSLESAAIFVQSRYRGTRKTVFRCELKDLVSQQSPFLCLTPRSSGALEGNDSLELHSALVIQSAYRRYMYFFSTKLQSQKIQAALRKTIICRKQLRQHTAATLIQARWRGFVAHLQFCFDLSDIVFVQSLARQRIAEKQVAKKQRAMKLIQRTVRKGLHMNTSLDMADNVVSPHRRMAAIVLQKHWRRYATNMDYQIFLSAVATIQGFVRSSKRSNVTFIYRHLCLRAQYAHKIQRWWRSLVVIQSNTKLAVTARKQKEEISMASKYHQAATHIQCIWRGFNVRVDYLLLLAATTNIQRNYRVLCASQRNTNDSKIHDLTVGKDVQDFGVKNMHSLPSTQKHETVTSCCEKETMIFLNKLDDTKKATLAPADEKEEKHNLLYRERNLRFKSSMANPKPSCIPAIGAYNFEELSTKCSSYHSTQKMYHMNDSRFSVDQNLYRPTIDQINCFAAKNAFTDQDHSVDSLEEGSCASDISKRGRNETHKHLDLILSKHVNTEHESCANNIQSKEPLIVCSRICDISTYREFEEHRQSVLITERDSFDSEDGQSIFSSCLHPASLVVSEFKPCEPRNHPESNLKRNARIDIESSVSSVKKNHMASCVGNDNITERLKNDIKLVTSKNIVMKQKCDLGSTKNGALPASNGRDHCASVAKHKIESIPIKNAAIQKRPCLTSRVAEVCQGATHLKFGSGVGWTCLESISGEDVCHSKNIIEKSHSASIDHSEHFSNDSIKNLDVLDVHLSPSIDIPTVARAAPTIDKGEKKVFLETFADGAISTLQIGPDLRHCHDNEEFKRGNDVSALCYNDPSEILHRGTVLCLEHKLGRDSSRVKEIGCQDMKLASTSSASSTSIGFLTAGESAKRKNKQSSSELVTEPEETRSHDSGKVKTVSKSKISSKLSSTSKAAPLLGPRTKEALQTLKTSTNLRKVMTAVRTLVNTTKLSTACCKAFAKSESSKILYDVMRSLNRCVPHTELLEYILDTLFHVSKHSDLIDLIADDNCIETLIDAIQLFRDKDAIFCAAAIILKRIVFNDNKYLMICQKKENMKRMLGIYKLRKGEFAARVEERRNHENKDLLAGNTITGESNGIRTIGRILEKCITKV